MKTLGPLGAFSAILLCATSGGASEQLVSLGHTHGVRVYECKGSPIIDLTASADIAATPRQVRSVLLDYARHPLIFKRIAESRVISTRRDSLLVYQRLTLPIVDDRDSVLRITSGQAGGTLWMRFVADNDVGPPPRAGVVRVPTHEGEWRLAPTDGGRATRAFFHVRLDLGGWVPGWMARSGAFKSLVAVFDAVRRWARIAPL